MHTVAYYKLAKILSLPWTFDSSVIGLLVIYSLDGKAVMILMLPVYYWTTSGPVYCVNSNSYRSRHVVATTTRSSLVGHVYGCVMRGWLIISQQSIG